MVDTLGGATAIIVSLRTSPDGMCKMQAPARWSSVSARGEELNYFGRNPTGNLAEPRQLARDLSSLRRLAVGAAPVSPAMMNACKARFAAKGWQVSVAQGYGMTELSV